MTVLQAYCNVDMGWTAKQVEKNVELMFSKKFQGATLYRFLDRHKDVVKPAVTKPLGKERAKPGLYEEAMDWVDSMEVFIGGKKCPAKAVVNYTGRKS